MRWRAISGLPENLGQTMKTRKWPPSAWACPICLWPSSSTSRRMGWSSLSSLWRIRSTRMVVLRIGLEIRCQERRLAQHEYHREEGAGKFEVAPHLLAEVFGDVPVHRSEDGEVADPGQAHAAPHCVRQLQRVLRDALDQHL